MMEIVKVSHYEDRGLLRTRIEWADGDSRGVADTHCALTGVPLGPNHTLCVRHCRYYGHYSKDVNEQLGKLLREEITAADLAVFLRQRTCYPDDMDDQHDG